MKKLTKRIISFMLSLVMLFSVNSIQIFAQGAQNITVDGYTFEVINKDINGVTLAYSDNTAEYIFYLDKQNSSGKSEIDISQTSLLSRSEESSDYKIEFDENVEYSCDTKDFSSAMLVDEMTGEEYSLNQNSRFAFVIPIGIPLLTAAIEALLVVGGAVIIAGVAYTIVEEVAEALKRQKTYRYYAAVLRNNAVYVGGGLETAAAKSLAYTNDSKGTVLATSLSYAKGLVGNSYRGPENHGSTSGYWSHIHAKNGSVTYKAHIWHL
jgi:hypothetical protein